MQDAEVVLVEAVRAYCSWVDSRSGVDGDEEAKEALKVLAHLYSSALQVKRGECGKDVEEPGMTHEEWKKKFDRFGSLQVGHYHEFFSPAKMEEEEPVVGNVADDLADIYRDLSDGLSMYDRGHTVEAMWEWKESFRTHWGRHAVSAMKALHTYLADQYADL
jgi:hypothetical protein